jgi:hypothetical protein
LRRHKRITDGRVRFKTTDHAADVRVVAQADRAAGQTGRAPTQAAGRGTGQASLAPSQADRAVAQGKQVQGALPTTPSAPVGSPTLVAVAPMAFVLFRVRGEDEEGQLDVKN